MMKNVKKSFFLTALVLLLGGTVLNSYAQDKLRQPDLQTADSYFFDPTREVKAKEPYAFGVEWRIDLGFTQANERSKNSSFPDMYLHGGKLGFTVDFLLPIHFSLQTGLYYGLTFGKNEQHYRSLDVETVQTEYVRHKVTEHTLYIPVRAYYTQKLAKKWRMLFFAGPQFQISLAQPDKVTPNLSEPMIEFAEANQIRYTDYDRVADNQLYRFNVQLGLGGGFEWDRLRLTAGYDFGLNNLVRDKRASYQHMWSWGWFVHFGIRIGKDRATIVAEKTQFE